MKGKHHARSTLGYAALAEAQVRERVAERLWQALAGRLDNGQPARLERLVVVPAGERLSLLERLQRAPTRVSNARLVGTLKCLEAIRALGVGDLDLAHIPCGGRKAYPSTL